MESLRVVRSVDEACAWALGMAERHPERDAEAALRAALAGRKRPHACLYLGQWQRPDDATASPEEFELPEVDIGDAKDAELARSLVGLLRPLQLLNPVTLALQAGVGTGTLAAALGAWLDPECGYAPRGSLTLDEALALPEPDPATGGLMGRVHEQVDEWLQRLPPPFRIRFVDTQGPFNLAHTVLGENVFVSPYDEPEKFHAFMARVTRHWVGVYRQMCAWIPPGRRTVMQGELPYLAECSVNLVSGEFYREFILPHDRAGLEELGGCHVHPCSGPHVFRETWRHLPGIRGTEAGTMDHRMAAGSIPVEEAVALVGDRPVLLRIGQELVEGREFETVARHLDLYAANRRLTFGYTGTYWLRKDRPAIRELHRRLDRHFEALP